MAVIITLIVVGLGLLLLETVLPGLISGILGVIALGAAVVYAYTELGTHPGNITLMVVVALLIIGAVLYVIYFPRSAVARMFVSERQIGNVDAEKPELLGQAGVALTPLRPAGTAVFNGKRTDVVTEGGFVEKGRSVKVVAVEGLRVVVRPAESS